MRRAIATLLDDPEPHVRDVTRDALSRFNGMLRRREDLNSAVH